MHDYFHQANMLGFQYQTWDAGREMDFRLTEFIGASQNALKAFHAAVREKTTGDDEQNAKFVRYRFSSLIGLIQTFKDLLPAAIAEFVWIEFVSNVKHEPIIQNLRNAAVHEAQPVNTLYADGQYYIAVNIRRKGPKKNSTIDIIAPSEDLETLALSFFESFATKLANIFEELPRTDKLKGPRIPYEWFEAAANHPALARFGIKVPAEPFTAVSDEGPCPLDEAAALLTTISSRCRTRLLEITRLPRIPFP